MTRAFWHYSDNFGDSLTPWIIEKLTGEAPVPVKPPCDEPYLVMTGSILATEGFGDLVSIWGAGIANRDDKQMGHPFVHAIRGPLSREALCKADSCYRNVVYGDPGLLLPRLAPHVEARVAGVNYVPGVIASWVDFQYAHDQDVPVLRAEHPVDEFLRRLWSRPAWASATLHGLVACVAYGIPCCWVKLGDRMMGDGTKFRDFFASIGYPDVQPLDWSTRINLEDAERAMRTWEIRLDLNALAEACPLPFPKEAR